MAIEGKKEGNDTNSWIGVGKEEEEGGKIKWGKERKKERKKE